MTDAVPRRSGAVWVVLALLLAVAGSVVLTYGVRGQAQLDLAWTEARLSALFHPLLIAGDELAVRQQVRELEDDERYALSFLAVRDATGQVLASSGVFESWPLRLVPPTQRINARAQLYRLTGDAGLAVLENEEAEPLGTVEFSRFRQLGAEVEAAVPASLRRIGISLLLAAAGVLMWLGWRSLRVASVADAGYLRERMRGQTPQLPLSEPVDLEPRHASGVLATLGVAMLRFGHEGQVQAMNDTAERWTGWREREAQTVPLLTVLKLLDGSGQPALGIAHTLLTDPLPEVLRQPLRIVSRQGVRRWVDLKVVAGGRSGREGGTVLLSDASPRVEAVTALEAETRVMREAMTQLDEAILIVSQEGMVRAAYGCAQVLFGYPEAEWAGMTLAKLFPVPFVQMPELSLAAFEPYQREAPLVRAWRKDAESFQVTLRAHRLAGDQAGWVVQVRDVRETGQLQWLAQRERRWFELGADQAFVMDAQTLSFIEVSAAAKAQLGYAPARWPQLSLPGIAPELDRADFQAWLRALREGQVEVVRYLTRHRSSDGQALPVRVTLQYLDDPHRPVFLATAMQLDA